MSLPAAQLRRALDRLTTWPACPSLTSDLSWPTDCRSALKSCSSARYLCFHYQPYLQRVLLG